jgi:hypothetical protein
MLVSVDSLEEGDEVEFQRPGYVRHTWRVSKSDLDNGTKTIELTPDGNASPDEMRVNSFWKKKGHQKHSKTLIATAGLALVSGAAAAYFKNQADLRFERAKLARQEGNVPLQRKLERETRRLDRYALVGFIGMEVNVVILVGTLILAN